MVDTGKADPSKESREFVLWKESGLLTVSGGKLTTFRLIAQKALRAVCAFLPGHPRLGSEQRVLDPLPPETSLCDVPPELRLRLMGRYGAEACNLVDAAQKGRTAGHWPQPVIVGGIALGRPQRGRRPPGGSNGQAGALEYQPAGRRDERAGQNQEDCPTGAGVERRTLGTGRKSLPGSLAGLLFPYIMVHLISTPYQPSCLSDLLEGFLTLNLTNIFNTYGSRQIGMELVCPLGVSV